jgi:hypothetical protein
MAKAMKLFKQEIPMSCFVDKPQTVSFSCNDDGTVTIDDMSNGDLWIMNTESCRDAIENITRSRDKYKTYEAYQTDLDLYTMALACCQSGGDND